MRLPAFVALTLSLFAFSVSKDCFSQTNDLQLRKQHIKNQESKVSEEAEERRSRSVAILKKESVPVLDNLPLIETGAESTRRTTEQVATRAMALCIVAVKGEGIEQKFINDLVEKYKLAAAFTPEEKKFIDNPTPTEKERIQFAWQYECYRVMLWALNYVDTLERPDKICDVKLAVSFLRDNGREGFLKNAKLRPQKEILDAADLIYRYHWATVDARINGEDAPSGLDGGVVMERHYALNWLMGYMDQAWDDISTDT